MTDLRITRLPSGLTVAIERVDDARSVATGAWVGVGARDEPDELCGVSHFLEHLLFKGTETLTSRDISRRVDRVGGDFNAFTAKEYTAYYCRMPAAQRGLALELLGDVVCHPALRPEDVEAERQVILEELAMDDDNPDDVAHRRVSSGLFGRHPLGRDTAGHRDTVAAVTREQVRDFFDRWYRAPSTVVSVAGPVDPDAVLAEVEAAFAAMPPSGDAPHRQPPDLSEEQLIVEEDDTEQVHLVIGWPAVARVDPDREALDVLNHVLGGGLSSRLFEQVRERRGLAYSVFSGTAAFADAGLLSVYAGTLPKHAAEVLDVIGAEVRALLTEGIDDDELEVAVGYLCGAYEMGLEDTGARMARVGGLLVTTGEVIDVDEQLARWKRVTCDDVRRVIERVLGAPRVLAAVGPVEAVDLI